jgi:hypothetical protein
MFVECAMVMAVLVLELIVLQANKRIVWECVVAVLSMTYVVCVVETVILVPAVSIKLHVTTIPLREHTIFKNAPTRTQLFQTPFTIATKFVQNTIVQEFVVVARKLMCVTSVMVMDPPVMVNARHMTSVGCATEMVPLVNATTSVTVKFVPVK